VDRRSNYRWEIKFRIAERLEPMTEVTKSGKTRGKTIYIGRRKYARKVRFKKNKERSQLTRLGFGKIMNTVAKGHKCELGPVHMRRKRSQGLLERDVHKTKSESKLWTRIGPNRKG